MRSARRTRLVAARTQDVHRLRANSTLSPALQLLPRPDDEFERAAEAGRAFFVLHDNELIAHAFAFTVLGAATVELGSTLVEPDFRGYGLQRLLFAVRVASLVESEGPETAIATVIDPANAASARNAQAVGFVRWASPDPNLFLDCVRCRKRKQASSPESSCCSEVFHLPWSAATKCVRELLTKTETATSVWLPHRDQTGQGIVVDVGALGLLNEARRAALWTVIGEP